MTTEEYKKLTLAQMQERKWVTTRVIGNSNAVIAAGRPVTVVAKRGGLTLASEECPHCGVRFFVTRPAASDIRPA